MIRNILMLFVLVLIAGCASAPEPNVRYMDPSTQGRVSGTGIESQDIVAAAHQAAQSIVNVSAIAQASQPPTILITPVVNRSSSPIDTALYTTKLRGTLMQNAYGKVRFLARDASSTTNQREQELRQSGSVEDRGTVKSGRQGATYDYILTAELLGLGMSNSRGQSDYFLIAFKLIDFKDMLVWESQYEIKKEGNESAIYR